MEVDLLRGSDRLGPAHRQPSSRRKGINWIPHLILSLIARPLLGSAEGSPVQSIGGLNIHIDACSPSLESWKRSEKLRRGIDVRPPRATRSGKPDREGPSISARVALSRYGAIDPSF
jgi:hypothetical protein